jgi:putative ABC transport system permease protein
MNTQAVKELSQLVEIDHIEPKTEIPFELRSGWKKKVVGVIGLPKDTMFYHLKSPDGHEINLPTNGIVLSENLAKSLNVGIGDEILIKNFLPDKEDKLMRVKGITVQYLGANAYMDIEAMGDLLGEKETITGAIIQSQDEVVSKLQNVKNIRQIQSIQDMKNSFLEFMDMMIYSVGVLVVFGGILGFAIVYNVTIISIGERTMEFSSLRVLGFDKKEIYKMITKENSIITFLGILLGIPLGYSMCQGIAVSLSTDIYTIPLIIEPLSYVITALATVCFVALAQLATIRKIYHLNFMEALKNRIS